MAQSHSLKLNYWQRQEQPAPAPIRGAGGDEDYRPECIIVDKVYDECTVCECPTFRFTELIPEPANVISCDVANVRVIDAGIPREGEVEFTVEWDQTVTFADADGYDHSVTKTFRFRQRTRLRGARPEMDLRFFHLVRCLNCRIRETDGEADTIECEVGLFVVVKVTFTVQLEVKEARFCPQPPECVQVSPIGCPEWAELCQRGDFWPPFPTSLG